MTQHIHKIARTLGMMILGFGLVTPAFAAEKQVITIKPDTKIKYNSELTEHEMGLQVKNVKKGDATAIAKLEKPITSGTVVIKASYKSTHQGSNIRNGFILAGSKPGGKLARIGTFIGARDQGIDVRNKDLTKRLKDKFETFAQFDAVITIDIDAKTVKLEVNGKTIETKMPDELLPIAFVGYSVTDTSTAFSPITIEY